MADEFKNIRDSLFRAFTGSTDDGDDDEHDGGRTGRMDSSTARALIAALFTRAGKGKDEVVQILAREIGVAVAAMLREPMAQLAKHQKLQISFEFVPKKAKGGEPDKNAKNDAKAGPKTYRPLKKRRTKAS